MDLQPITAQLHIVEGQVQNNGYVPGLFAQRAKSGAARSREKDVLLLHLTISGPLDETTPILNALTNTFIDTYFAATGGVTMAIRRSVTATNQHLMRLNQRPEAASKQQGALIAAVFRDEELYMAQVGESKAFIGHSFGLEAIPPEAPDKITPLGQQSGLDIRFYHNWLQPGNLLLISDPRIGHVENKFFVPALVDQTLMDATKNLTHMLRNNSARLILVEFSEDGLASFSNELPPRVEDQSLNPTPPVSMPARDTKNFSAEQLRQFRRQQFEQQKQSGLEPTVPSQPTRKPHEIRPIPSDEEISVQPQSERRIEPYEAEPTVFLPDFIREDAGLDEPSFLEEVPTPDLHELAEETVATNVTEPAPLELDADLLEQATIANDAIHTTSDLADDELLPAAELTQETVVSKPVEQKTVRSEPVSDPEFEDDAAVGAVEMGARQAASKGLGGLSKGFRWAAEQLTKLRSAEGTEPTDAPGERMFALILAIIVPIAVALIVSGVYLRAGDEVSIADLKQEIRTLEISADTAQSEDEKRQHLNQIVTIANQAEAIRPGDSEVAIARDSALSTLDQFDGIKRLNAAGLYQYSDDISLTSLAVNQSDGNGIYVLDNSNNVVYSHATDADYNVQAGDPVRIMGTNDPVGTHVIGDIIDILHRPAGFSVGRNGIAALDQRGALVTYFPNLGDTLAAPLGLASEWVTPRALADYQERMYVLDSGSSQIWRYLPDGNGFNIASDYRSIVLPDLDQASDFVITEDGSVVVLYRDGRLRRYINDTLMWDETVLYNSGVARMQNPTAVKIVGSGLNSAIYVLDPATDRLLEISFNGTLITQYKATFDGDNGELFSRATDFEVLANPLRIFVVSGNMLSVASE